MDTEIAFFGQDLLKKRDVTNFVKLRTAYPGDDLAIGDMLVHSFREGYLKKLPSILTTGEREKELRDVFRRRQNGIVRVMELGFQIIGTFALMQPGSEMDESWGLETCTLRCLAIHPQFHSLKLSELLLKDAIALSRRWNARAVCLHVQSGAIGVAKTYEKFGFKRDTRGDKLSLGQAIEGYVYDLEASARRAAEVG